MDYEIIDIQTVEVFLDEASAGQEITTIQVNFTWGDSQALGRIEMKGRPTDEEVLLEISKKGSELLSRTQAPVGETLPKKGSIVI